MRIRKHASKAILGTACSLPWPPAPQTPPPQASYPAAWPLMEVCELNQSPWDAMLSPPRDYGYPNPQVEDGGIMGTETVAAAGEVIRGFASSSAVVVPECETGMIKKEIIMEDMVELKENNSSSRKMMKKKTIKRKAASETERRTVGVTGICKKTDGKKWRCKNKVHTPHSLCSYHLAQLRSYNNPTASSATTNQGRSQRSIKAAAKTKAGLDSGSDLYYYYSPFGPWRGKRRSRDGPGGKMVAEDIGGRDNGEHRESKHASDAPVVQQDDNVILEGGGGYDDSEEEEEEEYSDSEEEAEKGRASGNAGKKRRKPIKARSLKSLL